MLLLGLQNAIDTCTTMNQRIESSSIVGSVFFPCHNMFISSGKVLTYSQKVTAAKLFRHKFLEPRWMNVPDIATISKS